MSVAINSDIGLRNFVAPAAHENESAGASFCRHVSENAQTIKAYQRIVREWTRNERTPL
jgi:hypothetical protein